MAKRVVSNYEAQFGDFLVNLRKINALMELRREDHENGQVLSNTQAPIAIEEDSDDDNDMIAEYVGDDDDSEHEQAFIDESDETEWNDTGNNNDDGDSTKHVLERNPQDFNNLKESDIATAKPNETELNYKPRWFLNDIQVGGVLGKGYYATVYKARLKSDPSISVALKVVEKVQYRLINSFYQLLREIKMQAKLRHPNIVRFYDFIQDAKRVYLMTELCPLGDLLTYVRAQSLKEQSAAFVFRQLVEAVLYCHSMGVIHREVKPENVYITRIEEDKITVKLGDFSCCAPIEYSSEGDGRPLERRRRSICGTKEYFAPEMVKEGEHDSTIDIWCLGICLYEMLCGQTPFEHVDTEEDLFQQIESEEPKYPSSMSPEVIHLLSQLLRKNPKERILETDILNHSWVKMHINE